ncbi:hypothetical protein Tco_1060371 [Tanacetum coccineum]
MFWRDGSSVGGKFPDGSSTSGSADGSLSSGPKPPRDWALPWPVIDSLPDSIRTGGNHFSGLIPACFYFCSLCITGGVLEKDPSPDLTARQSKPFQVLSSNKAPSPAVSRECFLVSYMGLLDYIRTADPRKVQAVEVQKGEEQVTLFDSIKHCFVSLDAPAAAQASGSGSGAGAEVSVSSAEGNVVEANVIPEGAFLDLTDPECDVTVVEKDVAQKQPEKAKRKKLLKRSDPLPAKRLRTDHPSLASGTGGKSLASLRRTLPEGSLILGSSSSADVRTHVTVQSSRVADAPVYTAADIVTSSRGKTLVLPTSDVGGSSQPETSEESTDSFYETAILNSEDAKRWSRTEHELELKEKLRVKYDARGVLLGEKDAEIARFEVRCEKKETGVREDSSVSKDTDISLLDSRASYLKSALDDSQAACDEARNLISSLSSERDGLASESSRVPKIFEVNALGRALDYDAVRALERGGFSLGSFVESLEMNPDGLISLVLIYHADVNAVAGRPSITFASVLNVILVPRARKMQAAALRQ